MASGSVIWLDEQYMSTASLLVNILYVMIIVGTVAASKGHHYFGVMLMLLCTNAPVRVPPGIACLFLMTSYWNGCVSAAS